MTDNRIVFADGVLDIVVQAGVVRMDYFAYSPTERDADGAPQRVFQERIVLPLTAFAQTFSAMERIMGQLVDRGVLVKADGETKAAEDVAAEEKAKTS